MLNKEQRKVLGALNSMYKSRCSYSMEAFYNSIRIYERYRVYQLCETLNSLGYFSLYVKNPSTHEIQNIELSYSGLNYLHDFHMELVLRCLKWLTDNLVGLAALTVSVIALLRTL